ncbi:hypothetical protein [Halomonas borealis]|uniref:hypothetical protein n=1 Tax=Halomonas borealis TaxID=2508710 RepID=UPI00144769A0|nr:hypothetical protein [Halomonas borealis]
MTSRRRRGGQRYERGERHGVYRLDDDSRAWRDPIIDECPIHRLMTEATVIVTTRQPG